MLNIPRPVAVEIHIRGLTLARYEPDITICPLDCLKAYINKTRFCVMAQPNYLFVMLSPINLYLGTPFRGGLKKTLTICGLILRWPLPIARGQHPFPKLMKRMFPSMRSWHRQAGNLPRLSGNIAISQLFKKTVWLLLSWASDKLPC